MKALRIEDYQLIENRLIFAGLGPKPRVHGGASRRRARLAWASGQSGKHKQNKCFQSLVYHPINELASPATRASRTRRGVGILADSGARRGKRYGHAQQRCTTRPM